MAISFEINSSALPLKASVVAFRGSEGISRPYAFDVYVNVIGDAEIDDAPGARATLTINTPTGLPTRFTGVIASIELLRTITALGDAGSHSSLYVVRIVPELWLLSLTKHSRIWTKKTIPDIIKEVLEEEGVARVEFRLRGSYDEEEHICQYKESSLNFIHRWMEREGMYYSFEQSDAGETLVITDSQSTSTLSRALPIPYDPGGEGDSSAGAHLDTFTVRHAALPAAVKFTDYDYAKPALEVRGEAAVSPTGIGEQVTYGSRFFTPKQGTALAKVRAEDLRAQAKTFHGSGPVLGVSSGYRFLVEHHPKSSMNGEYLAVTVDHFGYVQNGWGKAVPHEYTETYRVDLLAIDAEQQYRHPELAVWPRLDGYENAMVDGPATSDYAQLDSQGRYNLKFKFDEGTLKGGKASTWVRKMQPHAGTVEGWHFPERAGTEVICAFLGGDPDRPIIVGAIPTAIHPSPVSSGNHTQNVIQTGGKNRVEMEDLAGQQRVTISTPHSRSFMSMGHPLTATGQVYSGEKDVPDHQMSIWTDGNTLINSGATTDLNIGNNWNVWVTANHVEEIGANVTHWVGGNVEQEIEGTMLQEIQGSVTEAYHSTLTQDVSAAVVITHDATFQHTVEGTVTEEFGPTTQTIKGAHKLTVEGSQTVEIAANHAWQVSGAWDHKIEGPKSEFVGGAVQNIFIGLKSEFIGGIHINTVVGVDTNIFGAFRFLVGPEEHHLFAVKVDVEGELTTLKGEVNHLKGMEGDLRGLRTDVNGLTNTTNGLTSRTAGLERKMHGVQQQVTALHSMVNGLTSVV